MSKNASVAMTAVTNRYIIIVGMGKVALHNSLNFEPVLLPFYPSSCLTVI